MSYQKFPSMIIKEILGARDPKVIKDGQQPGYRHAGVLLPLLVERGIWKVLFTRRTDRVEHHKGQISFPGGAVDKGDASIEETVLRETYEEIGLPRKHIEILGRIDDVLTMASNYVVHPLVGVIACMDDLAINRAEVKRVVKAPLSLFNRANSEKRRHSVEYEGVIYETPAYEYGKDLIWGATAKMMENFMEIIGNKLCLPPMQK
ncbi:MAG: CoA pyrophosphatase [Desulfobacteraceae bacterium]|nr:CoA pyrophosphatase [Desulfobacteraceae bacterium]